MAGDDSEGDAEQDGNINGGKYGATLVACETGGTTDCVAAAAAQLVSFNWAATRCTARAALVTLVAALSDDPINTYFSGARRVAFVKGEVQGYLRALPRAAHFLAMPDASAVALWQLLPVECPRNELLAGWARILDVPPRLWRQLLRLELRYEAEHAVAATTLGPFYYLSFIATIPDARGRGLGSRLLAAITSRADAEGRWCLLEATSERSRALYERHSFVTTEVYHVGMHAPPIFFMRRAPASPVLQTTATGTPAGLTATGAPAGLTVPSLQDAQLGAHLPPLITSKQPKGTTEHDALSSPALLHGCIAPTTPSSCLIGTTVKADEQEEQQTP